MKNTSRLRIIFLTTLSLLGLVGSGLAGCGSGTTTVSDGTGSEVGTAAIGGSSTASEGSVALNGAPSRPAGYIAKVAHFLQPLPSAWAVPSCNWSLMSGCTNNSESMSFSSCSAPSDPAIRIEGSQTLTWTGASCCTSTPLAASSTTPCSFSRRTINASGTADPVIRSVGSHSVTLNTEDSSGYDVKKSGGFTVTCQGNGSDNTCGGQRSIVIAGAHYSGISGRGDWDHTVSTDVPLVEQGSGASRRVLSGTLRIQHNVGQYTSIMKIQTALTHTSGCCFPTGGSAVTTFSGGKLDGKSETVTYGPACGDATLVTSDQKSSGLTLHHCL